MAKKKAIVISELDRLEPAGVLTKQKRNRYASVFSRLPAYYDTVLQDRFPDPLNARAQRDLAFVIDNTAALAKKGLQPHQLAAIFDLTLPFNLKYYQRASKLPTYSYHSIQTRASPPSRWSTTSIEGSNICRWPP